ncbi:FAD-dependent oxidoreductase, partial [Vibrio parahaemolyticus]
RPIVSQVTTIAPDAVRAVEASPAGLRVIGADDTVREFAGVFVATETRPRAPFAADLGLALQESGAIAIDAFGRTSLDGVYAAGDHAHSDAYP